MSTSKFDLGFKLMKWVIIEPTVIYKKKKKKKKKKIKLFSEKYLIGKVLNILVAFISLFVDLETLAMVLVRMQESLKISKDPYFKQTIDAFKCHVNNKGLDFSKVKKKGAAIFYANHPLSGLDMFAIMSEIEKVRPDVKVLMAPFLENFPGIKDKCIVVKNMLYDDAKIYNKNKLDEINDHIKNGGSLLIFPAGKVSRWPEDNQNFAVDAPWQKGFIKIGEHHLDTDYYPIFVEAQPSLTYCNLQKKSKHLSNLYVIKELSNLVGNSVTIRLGAPTKLSNISHLNYVEQIRYLRGKLYELGTDYYRSLYNEDMVPSRFYSQAAPLVKLQEFLTMQQIEANQLSLNK